ncbi:hypothetical protein F4813DRAFT_29005 [Daldinia decipiens]|uniref:uncharacterized protein n=1 Tax=Daldinia decipiens TaxID=326647 RepID=UPI0020C2F163|nr:uncharacterized protein F4813DRAFT_29005 [Daldinia decipiens]KAI1659328.1 hypothetical protein F4813DRAFT_29005 [Daldinia decipiens]
MSPSTPLIVDSSSLQSTSNVQSFQSNSNAIGKTVTAITTGWIVGIVFIALAVIVGIILLLWMYNRNSKRRQQRMARLNAESGHNRNPVPGIPPPHAISSSSTYAQPSEFARPYAPPRYEVPDTPMPPREVPNNEAPRKAYESDSIPQSELPV